MEQWNNPHLQLLELPPSMTQIKRKKKLTQSKKPKKRGPKKKVRPFPDTAIGRSLRLNVPLEYSLMMESTGGCAPTADMIEQISMSSNDPWFRSIVFRLMLIKYRKYGCEQEAVSAPSIEMKEQAFRLRKKRLYHI